MEMQNGLNGKYNTDFLIIGGGIIGASIAIELKKVYPDCKITIIDKEEKKGAHASGRNSGVLHAGFYYTADSLKAKFTREGNALLTQFCDELNIPINKCGKVVVCRNSTELNTLNELLKRGIKNGVSLSKINEEELRKIEPHATTYESALYSPNTSSADPLNILDKLYEKCKKSKIGIKMGTTYLGKRNNEIITNNGRIEYAYLINAAGLYADKIAKQYNFSQSYTIVPFKGLYLYESQPTLKLNTHIYPVPNIENPFLGVHLTRTAYGLSKIGPTAIPCFWRENYKGLENFNFSEFLEQIAINSKLMFLSGPKFRSLAINETKKINKKILLQEAAQLLGDGHDLRGFNKWGKSGIRAQLVSNKTLQLEMDFIIEHDENSLHVLNAVSPGWTCAIPFSKYIVNKIKEAYS